MVIKRVALVTGVSSGIGRATAEALLGRGFRTFGTTRRSTQTVDLPPSLELVQLDVRDEESVRSCVRTVLREAGRIDALVNNAGYVLLGSSEEIGIDEAKGVFETNFFGILRMSQAILPIMREQGGGRIANISSILGFLPAPFMGVYAASKHALEGYSESLDHEVRQFGIRVSVVEPGYTRTDLGQNGQTADQLLGAYASERNRAFAAIQEGIANGDDPATVASVVLDALTSRSPRLRYQAGREAKLLSRLRRFAPSGLVDKGLRKQFRLEAA
jgi:NAD(P)-dependent dehydrogenase (short-subunit alcohol dehydrogenase family)